MPVEVAVIGDLAVCSVDLELRSAKIVVRFQLKRKSSLFRGIGDGVGVGVTE